jgi:hypothetical protein
MSIWTDAMRGLHRIALLDDQVARALKTAEEAMRLSIENRDRIGQIETALGFVMREQDAQRRLPPH